MSDAAFTLEINTQTPVLLNRWLMLDAILDGILEADGVPPDKRKLPLLAWDGSQFHDNTTASEVQGNGWVYCASATLTPPGIINVERAGHEGIDPRALVQMAATRDIPFRGGINPTHEFVSGEYPFKGSTLWRTNKGPTAGVMTFQRMVMPGRFRWHFQGNAEAVRDIISLAEGIGAKTRSGWGMIDHQRVNVIASDTTNPLWGITGAYRDDDEPQLLRPVPMDLFDPSQLPFPSYVKRMETCAPPYWRKEAVRPAYSPDTPVEFLITPF